MEDDVVRLAWPFPFQPPEMVDYVEKVAWTLPFQPSQIDWHTLDWDLLVSVWVHSTTSEVMCVPAFRRDCSTGVEYEPVYIELVTGADEPELLFVNGPEPRLDDQVLCAPLPKEMFIRTIDFDGEWFTTRVMPRLVRIETSYDEQEDGEPDPMGLTVSYSFLDVVKVEPFKSMHLLDLFRRRMRAVHTLERLSYQPFFDLYSH